MNGSVTPVTGINLSVTAMLRNVCAASIATMPTATNLPNGSRVPPENGGHGYHNPYCFTNWLCGGGIKPGAICGESDQWGYKPLDRNAPTTVYDIHATVLYLLGFDHTKLTFRHNGVDRRLTDVHGEVIQGMLA